MKNVRGKIIGWLIVAAIVAVGAYALWPKPVSCDFVTIDRGPLRVTVDEDGRTRLKERYVVSAPLAGRLMRIDFEAGDAVRAGETVLAYIEPLDPGLLDARELAEAQMRVRAAEAALAKAEPELARATAEAEFAERQYQQMVEAYETGAATEQELDTAATLRRTHEESRRAAAFALEIARYELDVAKAALIRTTGDSSGAEGQARFEVISPIDGLVLRVMQESAGVVQPGTALLELGDPVEVEVEIDVLSSDAVKIRPGSEVIFEHWGGEKPLRGVVRLLEPSGFLKISALGVEEQRVNVIADFVDAVEEREALGDGYRVEARIVVWESEDVLRVPVGALFRHQGEWAVFEVIEGKARTRVVELGHRNGLHAEVRGGLEAGSVVINHPSDQVSEGTKVEQRSTDE